MHWNAINKKNEKTRGQRRKNHDTFRKKSIFIRKRRFFRIILFLSMQKFSYMTYKSADKRAIYSKL